MCPIDIKVALLFICVSGIPYVFCNKARENVLLAFNVNNLTVSHRYLRITDRIGMLWVIQ